VWGERLPFNTVCGEYTNSSGGWVHSVAFSPSGNALAFVAHDSSVTVVYPSAPDQPPTAVVTVTTQLLPFVGVIWTREDQLVAAGHDCHPVVFCGSVDGWALEYIVDDPDKARRGDGEERESSALNMFRQMDLKGRASGGNDDSSLKTIHQNTISYYNLTSQTPYMTIDES
jgi:actin related protein 2/3 complex subunit 1A/1B